MLLRITLPLLLLSALVSGCRRETTRELRTDTLVIGVGGGFSGEHQEWRLLPDGSVLHRRSTPGREGEMKEIFRTAPDSVSHYLAMLDAIGFEAITLDVPGNRTWSVERSTTSGERHRVRWSTATDSLSRRLKDFYDSVALFIERNTHLDYGR